MQLRKSLSIFMALSLSFIALAVTSMAETAQDNESGAIPICRNINASQTIQHNFAVPSNISSASFILFWTNATSRLNMSLISPSGKKMDSSAKPPVVYGINKSTMYFIIPNPAPGNWSAEITAVVVPKRGEGYCAMTYFEVGEMEKNSSSSEELQSEGCLTCNKSGQANT